MKNSASGFTIVELLVVIVVIAILAAMSMMTYSNFQIRAKATVATADLRSTEKAFRLHFMTQGYSTWPREGHEVPWNLSVEDYIDTQPGFSSFMSSPPQSDTDGEWQYDNSNDTKDMPCGVESEINQGVNIAIKTNERRLTEEIDRLLDDGDGNMCGIFRWFEDGSKTDNAYFNISPHGRDGQL